MAMKTLHLRIGGMSCAHCESTIQKGLRDLPGVQKATASFGKGTAVVTFDADVASRETMEATVVRLGYSVVGEQQNTGANNLRAAGLLLVIVALFVTLQATGALNYLVPSQLAQAGMGYGMLFVIGLITSVHCVAMCGGISLSQCVTAGKTGGSKTAALKPSFLYNLGRVISYTVVGFIVGALGSVITFSPATQGVLKLIAGVFMVVMGVNMLGIFPWLRRLNPRMPKFIADRVNAEKWKSNSPLVVGLLNGLMPCGPLQAMQIYALSTGNPFAGALSMLLFSLGTVPLMFGLGALSSVLSRKFTHRMLTAGAVLVAVLGLSMLSQGWVLTGVTLPKATAQSEVKTAASDATAQNASTQATNTTGNVQVISSTLEGGRYPDITVKAGTPVQWTINAPAGSINGCNNRMYIPEYNIEHRFTQGDNLIEFTPTETGTFLYSCWMGMIQANITVVEADPTTQAPEPAVATASDADTAGNVQIISSSLAGGRYPDITVQAGTPVQWTINAPAGSINSCNNRMYIPEYNIDHTFTQGDNLIEFTPTETGTFPYSCWMGMIRANITVVEAGSATPAADTTASSVGALASALDTTPKPAGYIIPTDTVAVAEQTTDKDGSPLQSLQITLTDKGFSPAVAVVQSGTDVEWTIRNERTDATELWVPDYYAQLAMNVGENRFYLTPTGDFAFSNADSTFFGYVKVVEDVGSIDMNSIKTEAAQYQTLVYPVSYFTSIAGGSCCQ